MWANRAWVGPYFPTDTPPGRELATYGTWCTTVEGNTTFYATPPAPTIERWSELAPEHLRMCFKVPRDISHDRRLRNVEEHLIAFVDALAPLRDRLGPMQIQLPATFGPDDLPAVRALLPLLARLREDGRVPSWAIELRHPGFFAGGAYERPLNDLLADAGVDRVTLDSRALFTASPITREEREAWERKPRVPVRPVATGRQPLVRLIGQRSAEANLQEWSPWYPKLANWVAAGLEPHVFTHTPDNREALLLARAVWEAVAILTPLEELPEPETGEEQLGLF